MPTPSKWSVPFRLSNTNFVQISHLPMLATCPTHLILYNLIILTEELTLWSSSLWNFFQSPVTSSLSGPNFSSAPCS
jgi:hypothetical protein